MPETSTFSHFTPVATLKGNILQADGRAAAKLVPMSNHGEITFTRPEFSRETAESGGSSELKGSVLPKRNRKVY